MKRFGSRFSTTSMAGSHCNVSLSTILGSRAYQFSSACTTRNESPGPACRLRMSSGRPSYVVGGGPSTATRTCSTRRVSQNSTCRNHCTST